MTEVDFQSRLVAMQDLCEEARGCGLVVYTTESRGQITLFHGTSKANAERIEGGQCFNRCAFFYAHSGNAWSHARMRFGDDATVIECRMDPRCVSFSTGTGEFYAEGPLTRTASGEWQEASHD